MFSSILPFDFDLILGVNMFVGALMGFFLLGLGFGSKAVLGSTHVVEQLLFSIVPSILTFYFDLIWGHF